MLLMLLVGQQEVLYIFVSHWQFGVRPALPYAWPCYLTYDRTTETSEVKSTRKKSTTENRPLDILLSVLICMAVGQRKSLPVLTKKFLNLEQTSRLQSAQFSGRD